MMVGPETDRLETVVGIVNCVDIFSDILGI